MGALINQQSLRCALRRTLSGRRVFCAPLLRWKVAGGGPAKLGAVFPRPGFVDVPSRSSMLVACAWKRCAAGARATQRRMRCAGNVGSHPTPAVLPRRLSPPGRLSGVRAAWCGTISTQLPAATKLYRVPNYWRLSSAVRPRRQAAALLFPKHKPLTATRLRAPSSGAQVQYASRRYSLIDVTIKDISCCRARHRCAVRCLLSACYERTCPRRAKQKP